MTILAALLLYGILLSLALGRMGFRHAEGPAASVASSRPRPKRLLIVGATGGTGRQLVTQALERGYTVTALARDPSELAIQHPSLTVVLGDVRDAASLEGAIRGQEAVLSALGHKRYYSTARLLSEGTRRILQAMETQGVSRFVCVTSLGIGDSAFRMGIFYTFFTIPVVLPLYFWDKARQERIIAASSADWVIVRPGALNNATPRGRIRQGRRIGNPLTTVRISRSDVAAFMLDQLESDAYVRSAPGICW